jgi:ribosomal protein S18 acetylase RimI-like enzyme
VGDECSSYLEEKDRSLLSAWDREQLVGLACISHRPRGDAASIDQIFVRPDYRRWGIATRLVGLAIRHSRQHGARTLLVEAPVTNPVLLVYLKAGFRVSGFLDTHYPPGGKSPATALFLAYDLG